MDRRENVRNRSIRKGDARLRQAAAAAAPRLGGALAAARMETEPLERRVLMAFNALVNFQPAGVPVPSGFVADTGLVYGDRGNGFTYGWDADNTANTRDRDNTSSPNQAYDTFNHTEKSADRTWNILVPNGTYNVHLVAGDADATDSTFKFNVEGNLLLDGKPTSSNHWVEATGTVDVSDGKLTLTNGTGSSNNKIDFIEITSGSSTGAHPAILSVVPADGDTNVDRDAFVGADLVLPNGALNPATVNTSTVSLRKFSDNSLVTAVVNTSGGGDSIVLTPSALLAANTKYVFAVTAGVKDVTGATLTPFSMTFTTGTGGVPVQSDIKFEKVSLSNSTGKAYTSVVVGPDHKLYASSDDGYIFRWPINADGTLGTKETISSLRTLYGGDRLLIGMAFDPSSTATNLKLWLSHGDYAFDTDAVAWSGAITVLSGKNNGTDLLKAQDAITNLPRAAHNHLTDQLVFGPDGALYISQGGNTAQGAKDSTWGLRDETLLSAAILRVDTSRITPGSPLNVKTVDGGGSYNPFATSTPPVTLYATGVRNAYDLVWTADGHLYAPSNGSNAGGATPKTPSSLGSGLPRIDSASKGAYTGPSVPAINPLNETQPDYLYNIVKGGYYGHPNPSRYEFVLDGGNPTSGTDPEEIKSYPVGVKPDRNYRGIAWNFGAKHSADGIIEYRSNSFGGALKGKLLVVQYSGGDNIVVLSRNSAGDITGAQTGLTGMTGFADPLDLIEDTTTGNIYVAEYGGDDFVGQKITLLRPIQSTSTVNPIPIGALGGTDINDSAAGSTTEITQGKDYDVVAGGPNIDATSDGFHFANQQRTGDFDIQVRVDSLTAASDTSKAGLMARASLADDAANVFVSTTANKTFRLSYRSTTGDDTIYVHGAAPTFPGWLRLVRSGDSFTGYFATGTTQPTNWTKLGTVTVNLPDTLYFGLAVSSSVTTASTKVTAKFRQLGDISGTTTNNAWTAGPSLPVNMAETGGGVIGNTLYMWGEGSSHTWKLDLSNPNASWVDTGADRLFLGDATDAEHATEILNGKMYLIGGLGQDTWQKMQIYDPATNHWTTGPDLPFKTGSTNSAVINGEIYIAGGAVKYPSYGPVAKVAKYNPTTNQWTSLPDMPYPRHSAAFGTDGQKLYVFGGRDQGLEASSGTDIIEVYDPVANAWTSSNNASSGLPKVPRKIRGTSRAVFYNGEFYIFGGETSNATDPGATSNLVFKEVDIYNPVTKTWRRGTDMITARHAFLAANYQNKIYTVGGGVVRATSSSKIVEIMTLAAVVPPTVTVAATDSSASESGPDAGKWTVTRAGQATRGALTVNYTLSGSATNGTDYSNLSGTVTIPDGFASAVITLSPVDDQTQETGGEAATLTLTSGSGYNVGASNSATINIADNDNGPVVTLTSSDTSASETGPDNGTYTFTRIGSTTSALTVSYQLSGTATKDTDYSLSPSTATITIPAGSATATLTLAPIDDPDVETGGETATVTLSANAAYVVGAANSATVTIADDDTLPVTSVIATDNAASETGPDNGVFTISRATATKWPVTVFYTIGGTSSSGDFTALTGSATIDANQTSVTVDVTPNDDSIYEGATAETVVLSLANNANYVIGTANSATVNIADNDPAPPTISVVATDNAAAEGGLDDGTYQFTRSGPTTSPLTVSFLMSGSASEGQDYPLLGGTVTFATGSATADLTLAPTDDPNYETATPETAILTIQSSGTGAYLVGAPSAATVSITDNDPAPPIVTVTASDSDAAEAALATGTYTFSRTGLLINSLTVSFSMSGGALEGTDYETIGTSVIIPANESTVTLTLTPKDDALFEGAEGATLTIASGAYDIGTPSSATVTIADDDPPPPSVSVSASDPNAAEAGLDTGTYTFTRTGSTASDLVIAYTMSGGAQGGGVDYDLSPATVTILAGSTTATLTLTPKDDAFVEAGGEIATLTLGAGAGYTLGAPNIASITIADNDVQTFTSADIGGATPAGSTSVVQDGVSYNMTAGGANIAGTADAFRFAYKQQVGDFDVKVQVSDFTGSNSSAKAGLMARTDLTGGSAEISAVATITGGFRFIRRTSAGGSTSSTTAGTPSYPNAWVRLRRVGNTFTAFYSANGTSWTTIGSTTATLPSTLYLGLATTSATTSSTATAQFRSFGNATTPVAPAIPTNFTATAASATQINLGWSAVSGATLYRIQRKAPGETVFTDYKTTTVNSLADIGLASGSTYAYQVRAENGALVSNYTASKQATTLVPTNLPLTGININATPAGSQTTVGTTGYDITGGGADVDDLASSFRYDYTQLAGDFDYKVQVSSMQAVTTTSKGGLLITDSLTAGAREVYSAATPSGGYRFGYRSTANTDVAYPFKGGTTSFPNVWVRLKRTGDTFTGFYSSDGVNWTQSGQITIDMPDTIFFGLATAARSTTTTMLVQYRNLGTV